MILAEINIEVRMYLERTVNTHLTVVKIIEWENNEILQSKVYHKCFLYIWFGPYNGNII